jgi:hypothetical protein
MYTESTQCMVKSSTEGCPRCGEELSVALPGSVDIERVCICRSCAAVVTYGDVDVNGMSEAQALSSVPLSHRRTATA